MVLLHLVSTARTTSQVFSHSRRLIWIDRVERKGTEQFDDGVVVHGSIHVGSSPPCISAARK
jgi:hypothetical protein